MQSTLQRRYCPKHDNKEVLLVCCNTFCKKDRLICLSCVETHSAHSKDLIQYEQIEEQFQPTQQKCKQLIQQLNDKFDELKQFFKKLIQSIETKYDISIEKINGMETKQQNQYFDQIFKQDEQQLLLSQILNDGCIYFKDKIIQCKIEFGTKEDLEKAEILYKQGKEQYDQDNYMRAINFFDFALDLNKNHLQSLQYKGESLRMLGQNKLSMYWYNRALSIEPEFQFAYFGKGDALRMLNQYQEAIEEYDKALKIDPDYKYALHTKGECLRKLNKYNESIEYYDKVLQIDPQFKFTFVSKGQSLRMLQKYHQAIECFDSALQIDKNNSQALGSKGACLIELNQLDEAEVCLNKAIKLNPNSQFNANQLKKLQDKRYQ